MYRPRCGFGDAGGFNQQVIESSFLSQLADFAEQVLPQRAADASIGHFDELLIGPTECRGTAGDQLGINVNFAHVVDNHRDFHAFTIAEHMIQKCRLSCSEEPGKDSYGKSCVAVSRRERADHCFESR